MPVFCGRLLRPLKRYGDYYSWQCSAEIAEEKGVPRVVQAVGRPGVVSSLDKPCQGVLGNHTPLEEGCVIGLLREAAQAIEEVQW
jgi:hypothetical protein